MNKNMRLILAFLIVGIIIIAGCRKEPITPPAGEGTYKEVTFDPKKPVTTKQFSSIQEFNDFVKSHKETAYYGYYEKTLAVEVAAEAVTSAGVSEKREYSETNIQVVGVDEADIIKTDGNYIYTISNNVLYIIKAYPGQDAEIVSTIDYEDNNPVSLFINGNYLAVFGNFYDLDFFRKNDISPSIGMSFFDIYDISDKLNPSLEKEYKFEGNYFNARMTGNYIYFVMTNYPEYRPIYPTPIIIEDGVKRSMPIKNIYYYDIPYRGTQLVTVHSINIVEPSLDINSKSVAVEYGQNLYMSKNNIYITYTETINEYDLMREITRQLLEDSLTDADKELIEKIKATDNDVLSQYEKENKIMAVYQSYINYMDSEERTEFEEKAEKLLKEKLEQYEYLEFTVVNKIGVDDGGIEVKENGKVPGHIINQFSLDEKDKVLRIATTISSRWSGYKGEWKESTNNVYTLNKEMKIIGKIEGLAETEQIYSTRFIGDKLYMVTFRQVDPFFVIDLSNPTNIKELGKLKIPGFSRYLHPYDETTIIGIGKEATEAGRTTGLKISLFDVSDFENPKEIAKFVTEEKYAESTALYEHKAFLFSREKELLVIPAYSYEYRDGQEGYNGAFVFKINKNEITLRGLIDHSMGEGVYYYQPAVERSLYIEELLYTKSPNLLRINEIEDLSSVKSITLKKESKIPIY